MYPCVMIRFTLQPPSRTRCQPRTTIFAQQHKVSRPAVTPRTGSQWRSTTRGSLRRTSRRPSGVWARWDGLGPHLSPGGVFGVEVHELGKGQKAVAVRFEGTDDVRNRGYGV